MAQFTNRASTLLREMLAQDGGIPAYNVRGQRISWACEALAWFWRSWRGQEGRFEPPPLSSSRRAVFH